MYPANSAAVFAARRSRLRRVAGGCPMTGPERARYGEAHCYLLLSTMRVVGRTSGRLETWAADRQCRRHPQRRAEIAAQPLDVGKHSPAAPIAWRSRAGMLSPKGSLRAGGLIPDKQCVNAMNDA